MEYILHLFKFSCKKIFDASKLGISLKAYKTVIAPARLLKKSIKNEAKSNQYNTKAKELLGSPFIGKALENLLPVWGNRYKSV